MKKVLIIILGICFVLWACKKGSNNFTTTTNLFNASIGMTPISFFLNGTAVISKDTFGQFVTSPSIAAATYTVNFRKYFSTGLDTNIAFINNNYTFPTITSFPSGVTYSAIIYDSAIHPRLYYNPDNFPTTIADGKCMVRFFNLMTGSWPIYLTTDTGNNIAAKAYISARTFGDFGNVNKFIQVDTTTSLLRVLSDTATVSTKRLDSVCVRLDSTFIGFKNGKIYSLYLTGTINRTTNSLGTGALKPKLTVIQNN